MPVKIKGRRSGLPDYTVPMRVITIPIQYTEKYPIPQEYYAARFEVKEGEYVVIPPDKQHVFTEVVIDGVLRVDGKLITHDLKVNNTLIVNGVVEVGVVWIE